jgi:hypothetical protein
MDRDDTTARFDPSPEQVAAITRFLPLLEADGFSVGEWAGGEQISSTENGKPILQMPYFDYSPVVLDLVSALYDEGWMHSFDWMRWQTRAARYVQHPELLRRAHLSTLARLLTMHVRRDRFSEGHLAAMIECGHIAAILRRLETLRGGRALTCGQ